MKIRDLLEFEIPQSIANTPVLDVFGAKVTAGQIAKIVPGVDPETVVKYGKEINDAVQKELLPGVTVGDAVVTAVTAIPFIRAARLAKKGIDVAKAGGKAEIRRQVGQEIVKKNVNLSPEVKAAAAGISSTASTDTPVDTSSKKRKFNIGDKITVTVGGKKYSLPVVRILPSGYAVNVGLLPGKKDGETMTVPEPLSEDSATTSSGNIASLGQSPHIAGGTPAVLRRWSGTPGSSGTTGKSVKHKPMKKQSAKDNAITNPTVGNNLIA
jgi:hypothetical protein